ncbi:unnamed protein product [Nezara viridula]|uniref:Uncharacterized protein n=1 Tax=Nezara viridula TaxID=85310 RepID=A0A9P0EC12_NEZVI|nr:unnamed protein product [Nezara viridula]
MMGKESKRLSQVLTKDFLKPFSLEPLEFATGMATNRGRAILKVISPWRWK